MDCARNIITANFSGGGTSATTAPLWQWDYGQVLCITGIDLPAAFEVHFSTNRTGGVSTVAVGADGQVTIPNELLTIGKNINAWIYLSDSEGEGETEYSITIPVKARPMPETYDAEATGEFDDVVRQVSEYAQTAQTAADNAGASASAAAASASEAAASASAAESAKTAAETAQGKAEDAQTAAETAAQTATEKAQQTAQDAAQAALDAGRAESAAGRAEAAQTGAESAKTDAETAAQGAADSASAANASATSAGQAASAAAGSASAAARSATTAENAAQTATTKAGEASASASAAAASETAAQTAQQGAETAETNAGQSASTATTKAAEAAQSASNAAQSKTDAEAAATRAETAAATLTVDTALSDTSTNPVQNKVIAGEVTQLKSALEDFIYIEPTLPVPDKAWIRYSNGERVVSASTRLFVFNASGIKRIKAFLTSDTPVLCAIAFYTSDGISTSGYMANASVDFLSGVHNDGAWYETSVPDGCATIAITSKVPSASVANYEILFAMEYATRTGVSQIQSELQTNISAAQNALAEIPKYSFSGFAITEESISHQWPDGGKIVFDSNIGYIAKSDGQVKNAGSGTWIYSDFIPLGRLDGTVGNFVLHSSVACVAYYSRASFASYLGNLSITTEDNNTYTKEEVLTNAPSGTQYIVICTDGAKHELYAYVTSVYSEEKVNVQNLPVFGKKIMHLSFDDTNNAFADLTANADTYASLFDSPFFSVLKEMHETYGAVFSCYCFYNVYTDKTRETLIFSLANCTTKFRDEFEANSDWLRFGFHSIDNYKEYTTATESDATADWNTFINGIIPVVSVKSIDTLVRTQSFTGNQNACRGFRNSLCGAVGFLSSDYSETGDNKNIDSSNGYYLTAAQSKICGRMGKYYEPTESLYFFPSNWRIDWQTDLPGYLALFNTADRFNRRRYMIMYGHENTMTRSAGDIAAYRAKLITICQWAKNNGYLFAFPADLISY